jgi:hypothetical protein
MFAIFLATLRMKDDRGCELPMFATTSDHSLFRLSSPSYFPGLQKRNYDSSKVTHILRLTSTRSLHV